METQQPLYAQWGTIHKIWFRFVSAYIVIYIFPFPANLLLESGWGKLGGLFFPLIDWVGHNVLQMTQAIHAEPNGSGDTSYNYVQLFIFLVLAALTAIIWSLADRKRPNYKKMRYWVRVLVRYYLACYLLIYGFGKFNNGQFPAPSLSRLIQPYGRSSPMGLAWTFLGFSKAYGVFMGFSECIGGVLMLFRRTALFGACIATTVVMNIVMINFCYDVCVKLFSSHLLLFCLFVLCTEGSRFLNLFIFNKAVPPVDLSPVFQRPAWKITRILLKIIFLGAIVGMSLYDSVQQTGTRSDVKPPMYGLYDVQVFVQDHDTIPPLPTESARWHKFSVMDPKYAAIRFMDEDDGFVVFQPDTVHKTVIMYPYKDSTTKYQLTYQQEGDVLELYGKFHNYYLYVKMKRSDEKNLLLINRGFHWINEMPFSK